MANKNSFNEAATKVKTAGLKEATKKLVVNLSAEFGKRGIDTKNLGIEK